MFYENAEYQLASFHIRNQNNNNNNNNAIMNNKSYGKSILNIVLIGDKNIGKSRLIKQFIENIYPKRELWKKDYHSLKIVYKRNEKSNEEKLHLKFHSINLTYKNEMNLMSLCSFAHCLLFVYDINNEISLNHLIDRCLPLIQNDQSKQLCSNVLIGIKHRHTRQVNYSEVELLIRKFKLFYYEIKSSNSNEELLKEILDNYFDKKSKITTLFDLFKHCK